MLALNATSTVFLVSRLIEAIFLHIWENLFVRTRDFASLILAVVGGSGTGKTTMTTEALDRLGVHVVRLPASCFESQWSNVPAERIKRTYFEAATYQAAHGRPAAVVVDDLDLALGAYPNTFGTSNRQNALSALMELCDHPNLVDGTSVDRVPIIVTANDMNVIRGTVTRPGRMSSFEWIPSAEETQAIVLHMLTRYLSPKHIRSLLSIHKDWSIADFGFLRVILQQRAEFRPFVGMQARDILLQTLCGPSAQRNAEVHAGHISDAELARAVAEVQASQAARRTNYLGEVTTSDSADQDCDTDADCDPDADSVP